MTATDATTGGTGFVADAEETTSAIYEAPSNFYPVTKNSLKAPWQFARARAMRGTRMTNVVMERSRLEPAGSVAMQVNPALGLQYYKGLLGGQASVSAIAAAQTTADVVTANGLSTLTVPGAWIPGTLVLVNVTSSGAYQATTEARIAMPGSGSGTLITAPLTANAAATTGIYVKSLAATKYANSLASDPNGLPSYTVESNKGKQWSWIYPGTYVGKIAWNFAEAGFDMTIDLESGGADPIFANGITSPAMSTYAPNATDESHALRPFTGVDALVVTGGDPDATGTSTTRAALGITDAKITFDNKNISLPTFNGTHTRGIYPGDEAGLTFEYNEVATAKRNDVWEDYIKTSTAAPFVFSMVKNYGTAAAPNYGGVALYIPQARFSMSDTNEDIGKVNTFAKQGEALAGGGINDYLLAYVTKPA